jgi:hypothetical protein
MLIPVKEYTSAAELKADAAERRARFKAMGHAWHDPPKQAPLFPPPPPLPPAPPAPPAPRFVPKRDGRPPASLADLPAAEPQVLPLAMSLIIRKVARFYGVRVYELSSRRRLEHIVLARHVAAYLCRTLLGRSFPEIGMHGVARVVKFARSHWEFAHDLWEITEVVKAALSGPPSVHVGEDGEVLYGEHRGPSAETSLTATTPRRAAHLWRTL